MTTLSRLIERTLPIIAIGGLVWLLADHLPWQREVVVYRMFCPGGRQGKVCPTREETASRTTYKAFVDAQTVVYWSEGGEEPARFGRCAVRDVENWTCQYETTTDAPPQFVHRMIEGVYSETANPGAFVGPSTDLFYPVSKWRWWTTRVKSWGR